MRAPEVPEIWADPDRMLTVEDMEDMPDDEFRLGRKKDVCERFGIRSYWIADPDPEKPGLRAFELRRGKYAEAARVTGDEAFDATRPFPVRIVPASLVEIPAP
jgi:hypothetical protein